MPLPDPTYESAKGVFRLAAPSIRRPDDDDPFIRAVQQEFPTLVVRQVPPAEAPTALPYLALASGTGSSRLALSAAGSEFDVRFYGEFSRDRAACLSYLRGKLQAAMQGWAALDIEPAFLGIVVTLNFAFAPADDATAYLIERHTKYDIDPTTVADVHVRLGAKLDDTYFVTLLAANYESKELERPVFPGQQLQVKPWEGEIVERGIQLTIDLNNRLEAISRRTDPVVDAAYVEGMLAVLERVLDHAVVPFVESGALPIDALTREEA